MISALLLVAAGSASAAVPQIPDQFYAEIHANNTGTVAGIPYGTLTIKQWYDYTHRPGLLMHA